MISASPPTQSTNLLCFHCGLPVPRESNWQTEIGGSLQTMCCPGCQAVSQAIVESGCADYYRSRSAHAARVTDSPVPLPILELYDKKGAGSGGTDEELILSVQGIRCAACAWLIERRMQQLSGVSSACLNLSEDILRVCLSGGSARTSEAINALQQIGYTAFPYEADRHDQELKKQSKRLFRQCFIAGLSMMQVMMYAFPAYLDKGGAIDEDMRQLLHWASFWLSLPALSYSALPFYQSAWSSLLARRLNMDVPVSLGILAGFAGSAWATWSRHGEVYFDSITMFVFLLLCSRYLELAARKKAGSRLAQMRRALPASANLLTAFPHTMDSVIVNAASLQAGAVILVKPGECFPADGSLLAGNTAIDASLLSGESRPLRKSEGDAVPGGAINIEQAAVLRVEKSSAESTLASLVRLAELAGADKPELVQKADRIAAKFTVALLGLSVATFLAWSWIEPAHALQAAIAVLVVSCPCALSLATPSALAAAGDRLLKNGVLITRTRTLESLSKVSHIIFDKTGTLTRGKPTLLHTETFADLTRTDCVRLAAAMEIGNRHPLAYAFTQAAAGIDEQNVVYLNTGIAENSVHHETGAGLQMLLEGATYRLGSRRYVEAMTGKPAPASLDDTHSLVYLGRDKQLLARFHIGDTLREDAMKTMDALRARGKILILLSGDEEILVQATALQLGIDQARGGQSPDQKLLFLQELQHEGATVAVVGDGINDAAMLRAGDVSFAMGSGSALAQVSADAVILTDKLGDFLQSMECAVATMRIVRQNLAWAAAYNLAAIPMAVLGWLTPGWSGLGMAISSLLVVTNSLRLQRAKLYALAGDTPSRLAKSESAISIENQVHA